MKNLRCYLLVLLAAFSFTFSSCDDDDDKLKSYDDGIFVVNEGNFGDADGTISHIDEDGNVSQDLFGKANKKEALGDVVQSMVIDDDADLAYIVINNDNKIEVANAHTFKSVHTITGLALPRYFTTFNGKGYVTEWVSFVDVGRVSIIDLTDYTVEESITTDYGSENIIAHEGELYVSNNFSNTVSVIDPTTKEVIKTIEVGTAPGAFVVDEDNMLWVVCGGGTDSEWNPLNDGKLVQIDPSESDDEESNSVLKTIELNVNVTAKMAINKAKDKIYYYKGKSVYAMSIADTEAPAEALFTEATATSFYGIGIDPENDMLYLADSKAFVGNGAVYRYSLTGTFIDQLAVGRGPNSFVFE